MSAVIDGRARLTAGRLLISHRYAAKRDTFPMTEFRIANYARTRTGRWLHDRAQFRRSCQAA